MNIYNYHPVTKAFVGASIADESPLEEGVYLIPAYATTVAPPQIQAGSQAVFENDGWRIEAIPLPPTPEPPPEWSEQEKINAESRQFLSQTDWYIIRKVETGIEVPSDVLQARAAARAAVVE